MTEPEPFTWILTDPHKFLTNINLVQFCRQNLKHKIHLIDASDTWGILRRLAEGTNAEISSLCETNPGMQNLLYFLPFYSDHQGVEIIPVMRQSYKTCHPTREFFNQNVFPICWENICWSLAFNFGKPPLH